MISINASYTNLVNQRTLATNTTNLQKATKRLATGAKINSAVDDAAGLFVGTSINSTLSGMRVALDNTMQASNFLNIANGALNNVSDNLIRMNALASQACNGIMSNEARAMLQAEFQALAEQSGKFIDGSKMNGQQTIQSIPMGSAKTTNEFNQKTKQELIDDGFVELTTENLANSENKKFYITSAEQLKLVQTLSVAESAAYTGENKRTFTLAADIDLSGYNWKSLGESTWALDGSSPSSTGTGKRFREIFDGNGHVISNLTINPDSYEAPENYMAGLFGSTESATITNLGLENVNIKNATHYTGALCGYANNTTIENVYVTGNITAKSGSVYVGGIAGALANNSKISSSYATCSVTGSTDVGGLAGSVSRSTVENSYSTGKITGNNAVGGLVGLCTGNTVMKDSYTLSNVEVNGYSGSTGRGGGLIGGFNTGTITNCYTGGNITGNEYTSLGLVFGRTQGASTINGLVYNTNATINGVASGVVTGLVSVTPNGTPTGLSANEFSNSENFTSLGWDESIWDFSSSSPKLKGTKLTTPIQIQVSDGADANSSIDYDYSLKVNFNDLANVDLSSVAGAKEALRKVQNALNTVTEKQANIGTQLNRLAGIATASQMKIENLSAAKSTIMDTDIASEVSKMTSAQILQQIGTSVLTQSRKLQAQTVLALIG